MNKKSIEIRCYLYVKRRRNKNISKNYHKVEKMYKLLVAAIATEFSLGCHDK